MPYVKRSVRYSNSCGVFAEGLSVEAVAPKFQQKQLPGLVFQCEWKLDAVCVTFVVVCLSSECVHAFTVLFSWYYFD